MSFDGAGLSHGLTFAEDDMEVRASLDHPIRILRLIRFGFPEYVSRLLGHRLMVVRLRVELIPLHEISELGFQGLFVFQFRRLGHDFGLSFGAGYFFTSSPHDTTQGHPSGFRTTGSQG